MSLRKETLELQDGCRLSKNLRFSMEYGSRRFCFNGKINMDDEMLVKQENLRNNLQVTDLNSLVPEDHLLEKKIVFPMQIESVISLIYPRCSR